MRIKLNLLSLDNHQEEFSKLETSFGSRQLWFKIFICIGTAPQQDFDSPCIRSASHQGTVPQQDFDSPCIRSASHQDVIYASTNIGESEPDNPELFHKFSCGGRTHSKGKSILSGTGCLFKVMFHVFFMKFHSHQPIINYASCSFGYDQTYCIASVFFLFSQLESAFWHKFIFCSKFISLTFVSCKQHC